MSSESGTIRGLIYIVAAALLAVFVGTFFPILALRFEILGDLFLNALKMMVLPLVITSIIGGVTSLGHLKSFGSLGIKTLLYYMITTALAVGVGILLVNLIRPGDGMGAFVGVESALLAIA